MKKNIICLFALTFCALSVAASNSNIYSDELAIPEGFKMQSHVVSLNIRHPRQAKKDDVSARVQFTFNFKRQTPHQWNLDGKSVKIVSIELSPDFSDADKKKRYVAMFTKELARGLKHLKPNFSPTPENIAFMESQFQQSASYHFDMKIFTQEAAHVLQFPASSVFHLEFACMQERVNKKMFDQQYSQRCTSYFEDLKNLQSL